MAHDNCCKMEMHVQPIELPPEQLIRLSKIQPPASVMANQRPLVSLSIVISTGLDDIVQPTANDIRK